MSLEQQMTKRLDERETHYFGLAGRMAYCATAIGALLVAAWHVFEWRALHVDAAFDNAVLAMMPVLAGAMTFLALQLKWKITRQK